MQDRQFNGCAICKQPCKTDRELAVDHNHKTGQIRDLLCHSCNVVLGLVNENEDILINMIDYLKRHSKKSA
jgi:MinD superfamily P-loop ATPase